MNKSLQTFLRLDGLILTRKRLELTGLPLRKGSLDKLDQEIGKLRRRLPPAVMSQYDRLSRQYADPISLLAGDICQGCRQPVATLVLNCAN